MFRTVRTYRVTFLHARGPVVGRDVCLSDDDFRDRKSLAKQLRGAGALPAGGRVTSFRGEAGGRVVVAMTVPGLSSQSGNTILECIPFDMPHARLAMGKGEPGQTIDARDVVITTDGRAMVVTPEQHARIQALLDSFPTAGPAQPGQTIDAGDVVIETTLHRLG